MDSRGQDPPDSQQDASTPQDDLVKASFRFECPLCGERLQDYAEQCPQCGAELGSQFSATYRVSMPRSGRHIALGVLIFLALIAVSVAVALVSQALAPSPPG